MSRRCEIRRCGSRRQVVFRLLSVFAGISVACAMGEVGLRIGGYGRSYFYPFAAFHENDPLIGIRGRANFTGRLKNREMDAVVVHDEHGFRKPLREIAAAPVRPTVYVLGDSFIWGWGVDQGRIVTERMQERLPDCRVRNLGISATGTLQQYLVFEKFVLPSLDEGDTVVLGFYGNDFGDNVGRNHEGRPHAHLENGEIRLVPPVGTACSDGLRKSLTEWSYLINLLTYGVNRGLYAWNNSGAQPTSPGEPIQRPTNESKCAVSGGDHASPESAPSPDPAALPDPLADDTPEVQVTKYYLDALKTATRDRGARFVVVYVPFQIEIGDIEEAIDPAVALPSHERQALLRCTKSLGIPTIDLVPEFIAAKAAGKCRRLTFVHDFHWNDAGHLVAADVICAVLASRPPTSREADAMTKSGGDSKKPKGSTIVSRSS